MFRTTGMLSWIHSSLSTLCHKISFINNHFSVLFFFLSFSTKRKIWKNNATRQTNQTCSSKALPCSSQTLILFKRRKKKHFPNFQDYTYAYQFYFFLNMVLIYTYIRNLVFIHIPYTIVIHFSFLLNLFSFYYTYVHILFSLSLSLTYTPSPL